MGKEKIKTLNKIVIKIVMLSIFSFVFFIFSQKSAQAGSIYISPNSKTATIGQSITLSVIVSSADQAMNATSGRITFPTDKLEVTSLSKSGTIISLWVKEPSFSNAEGVITFEGISLNPGFLGSSGKVLSVTFKAKSQGPASVNFATGSLLANDGQGTSLLSGLGSSIINISPAAPPPTPKPTEEVQPNLKITNLKSFTHPDQDKWYSNNNPKLEWTLPDGATGTSLSIDKNSNSDPGNNSDGLKTSYEATNQENGVYYFHVKARNAKGWGLVEHFKFQIDREKPDFFNIREIERSDKTTPKISFNFESSDKLSGIEYYEIVLKDSKPIRWTDDGKHIYETPILEPGNQTILLKAVDKAGNYIADFVNVTVEALKSPTITDYQKNVDTKNNFFLKGNSSYPNSEIIISFQRENDEKFTETYKTDKDGNFSFDYSKSLKHGSYKSWVEVKDERGAKSLPSEVINFEVGQNFLSQVITSNYFKILPLILLFVILVMLSVVVIKIYKRLHSIKKNLHKHHQETASEISEFFSQVTAYVQDQIRILEKAEGHRKLTEEEEKILFNLKKERDNIDNYLNVDKYIDKE